MNQLHTTNGGLVEMTLQPCNCIIHKAFYGTLRSIVTCRDCTSKTITEDSVMDLSLDIRMQIEHRVADYRTASGSEVLTLQACLERFTSAEKLGPNQYVCENCTDTEQGALKQLTLQRLPSVLCMQLKRFGRSKDGTEKVERKLQFPLQLDMSPYTKLETQGEGRGTNETVDSCLYDLSSVVVHKGDMQSGHYISFCRQSNQWFLFDDSRVTKASELQVLDANAYLLIYVIRTLC
ncbi:MAG: hypothetical protein M1812_000877 [Candelaria pacifica]|nr:MAG: hypothetical protein M1812_000877 [Candelaria pacifica]